MRAFKVRIRPTEDQEEKLVMAVGTARWAYNWALDKQLVAFKEGKKFISQGDLRKELTILKGTKEYSWIYKISNHVTKQAIKDLCLAYDRFFKGKSGKPRFKKRNKSKWSFYNDTSALKVRKGEVLLSKIGWVKITEQIPKGEKYKNPRVSFDGKYWYISVVIERSKESKEHIELTGEVKGIDVGVRELAICSDGLRFKNINKTRGVKLLEKRKKRLQRSISRKYERNKEGKDYRKTSNIKKEEKKLRLIYRRLNNIRQNHIFQVVNTIVKTKPSVIVMEDIDILGMVKNKHISRQVLAQKLFEFKRVVEYKCEWLGIEFVQANRYYPSSKRCSGCGNVKKFLSISERVYKCGVCGLEKDRDYNASLNLREYYFNIV